jgi:adenylate kinase family enzyme
MSSVNFRVHLLGASGSGTTTLGRALAGALDLPHVDADDVFWEKTDPPFSQQRAGPQRELLLRQGTDGPAWVLSGSAVGWGDFLRHRLTHAVFLDLPPAVRLRRLRARELECYGARVGPGGDMEKQHQEFLAWATRYDEGGTEVRSLSLHERWLRDLPCPVLRLSGLLPPDEQLAVVRAFLSEKIQFWLEEYEGLAAASFVDPFFAGLGRNVRARDGERYFVARVNDALLGAVRLCREEGTPMLRGMLVAERARKQGVGRALLKAFDEYLAKEKIRGAWCVPHAHLESFYARIGFVRAFDADAPGFLRERVAKYRSEGMDAILMRRP